MKDTHLQRCLRRACARPFHEIQTTVYHFNSQENPFHEATISERRPQILLQSVREKGFVKGL
ncbi:zinc ribbon domain-containing protein [Sesbania bispinosa]|nr:zinc ribbon domain-containing protein [Sesbania bispinosa]